MTEQADSSLPRRRLARRVIPFLVVLVALAGGMLYSATAVLVRVDNVILPGVDLPLPGRVTRALPGLDVTPAPGAPGTNRITILLLGVDRRPHHDPAVDGPPNADSIHLLSVDPVTKTATAIAIPRDLYLEMPSPDHPGEFLEERINTAYELGEARHYPGGGSAYVKRVVEYTFHITIDYYAVVDWVAFADVIDELHGIDLDSPKAFTTDQGFNPRDGNSFKVSIPAGPVHLDAVGALAYSRFRDDDEVDFGRMRRQQQVMRAAGDKALELGWLGQGAGYYGKFRGAVDTDLSVVKLPGVLNLLRLVGPDGVTMRSLAGDQTEAVQRVITPFGQDVLVPRWEIIAPLLRETIGDRVLSDEGATVSVANATGKRGMDAKAINYLSRFALPPERLLLAGAVEPSAAPSASAAPARGRTSAPTATPTPIATTIVYSGAAGETARRLADWLNLPRSRVSQLKLAPDGAPAVTVTLGTDVRLPDDERFHTYRAR